MPTTVQKELHTTSKLLNLTLITDMEGIPSPKSKFIVDAMTPMSDGKVKAVTSKLVLNWQLLMQTECNVQFFASLLKRNISTHDVHSFVKKQANLRKIYKGLDKPLNKAALRSKLNDACAFVNRQKRVVTRLKQDLLKATEFKKFKHRRILKQIKTKIETERRSKMMSDSQKVDRYAKLQLQMERELAESQFKLPASISGFAGIKAFNLPKNVEYSQEMPMIYDDSIVLSEDELAILAKGPKFAVRQKLMKENFKLELEKMVCKQKFGEPQDSELNPSLFLEKSSSIDQSSRGTTAGDCKPNSLHNGVSWEEKRSQLVYDFETKNLNPNRLKATDYRFNKTTNLPKPQSTDLELKHELRKAESIKLFDKVTSSKHPNPKNSFKTPFACKSNLTPNELAGLKSLQNRIASNELVVCESDKSSKLCVLSRAQYLASGMQHCNKDLEISITDVARLQKYVNSHVEWFNDIFGTGTFWGHEDRIRISTSDLGAQVAPLRLLLKDHKSWSKSSDKPIPSRPVVNGRAGYNNHLSEILSLILGPISREANGCEINSTVTFCQKSMKSIILL